MTYFKSGTTIGAIVILCATVACEFAPTSIKLPGLAFIALGMVFAAILDSKFSPARLWNATKKAAQCGCDKAIQKVVEMPVLLQTHCAACGMEVA